MENQDYISRLEKGMEGNFSEEYIQKCINYSRNLLEKDLPVLFDSKHIKQVLKTSFINIDYYQKFTVYGKRKDREITAPSKPLKQRQQWILEEILEKIPVSNNTHGFIKTRSIVTNAKKHVGKKYILNIDIKDFFPSITEERVFEIFKKCGYSNDAAKYLTSLTCYQGVLPQGAPTSPYLANLVLVEMDAEIEAFCNKKNIVYTRYADDMSFSANDELLEYKEYFVDIIEKHGFKINKKKTVYYESPYRKMVTGLVVKDDGVYIPKSYKRKFRQEIFYCKINGVEKHLRNTGNGERTGFKEYMYGKAYYINMVEPALGKMFLEELDEIIWDY